MYHQSEASECGLVCLAVASASLGAEYSLAELRRRFPVSSRGLTMRQLSEIAAGLEMLARGVKCDVHELVDLKRPAVLHWGMNHFVVLERATKTGVTIYNPSSGRERLTYEQTSKLFTGIALELSAAPGFKVRRAKSPLSVWEWVRLTPNLYAGIAQVLLLSALLQIYVIASPFYIQLAVDQGALRGDSELLAALAIGFGLFGLFNVGAGVLRSFAIQHISASLSWDMSLRLFRHLVRLPLDWFQKRRLADTVSRFDAINPIRDQVSGALITSVIDGSLGVITLIMMFLFSWKLGIWVLSCEVLYILVRLLTLSTSLRLSAEGLMARVAENGKRIETIRAIQTIKVMGAENEQEVQWSNRYSEVIRRNFASTRFDVITASVQQSIETLITTLVVWVGATAIVNNEITVGILYAFLSYKAQFASASKNVVDQLIQWRLNDIYSYRLADIVLSPRERGIDEVEIRDINIRGRIEIENLFFRYAPYEPFVFERVNLVISAGEMIAIVGPSGSGKSSLLKILAGLYTPTSGEVRIDGRAISAWGPKAVRKAMGVVMQDDDLLSGTIAENVAFFNSQIDMDRVWDSLEAACLKDEVMAMPMKAETYVGDMGGALSGGQRQRLLIARALYKRPSILMMDEATSHLDVENEKKINEALKKLNITRVIIAHRPETICAADRIFDISMGKILI